MLIHTKYLLSLDVGFKPGVEAGHALVVDEFAEQLPFVGVLDEHRAVTVILTAHHNEGVRERSGLVEIVLFLPDGDGRLACRTAGLKHAVIVAENTGIATGNAELRIVPSEFFVA